MKSSLGSRIEKVLTYLVEALMVVGFTSTALVIVLGRALDEQQLSLGQTLSELQHGFPSFWPNYFLWHSPFVLLALGGVLAAFALLIRVPRMLGGSQVASRRRVLWLAVVAGGLAVVFLLYISIGGIVSIRAFDGEGTFIHEHR